MALLSTNLIKNYFQHGVDDQEQQLLSCQDRRQNGTCRCIERYILGDHIENKQKSRLDHLLQEMS